MSMQKRDFSKGLSKRHCDFVPLASYSLPSGSASALPRELLSGPDVNKKLAASL